MVPSADEHAGGPPTSDPAPGQPPEELGHRNVLPHAGQAKASCMASVREFFVDRGFSAGIADTAARARRESTCWIYDSHILHYRRWCVERIVDPAQAPLTQVAEIPQGLTDSPA